MYKIRKFFDSRCFFWRSRCALVVVGLTLIACTPQVTRQASGVQPQGAFSAAGQAQLPAEWWLAFDDPALNRLMTRALANNLTLQSARDRLDQARAVARKAGASLTPQLNGEASFSSSRSKTRATNDSSQNVGLGLAASYEIDLWGRLRANSAAAEFDALASAESLQTAALTLSAGVATTWFQLLEQRGQSALLQQQLETNQKTLALINLQFRTGQAGIADVLQQRQAVESRQGEMALTAARTRILQNQLAILLGEPPEQDPEIEADQFAELPPLPATGLQSALLERRPDVRAAWLQVLAADQRVTVAAADRFPRLSLTGRASTSEERIEDLFNNWLASLAANLLSPLIDGGQRRAEVERSRAAASEALHDYGQTVLTALTEVEDALVREQRQQDYLASINRQLVLATQATGRIRDRYLNGAEDYQRVLASQLSEQQLQRTRLTAHRDLYENRIALCRALAGGWEMSHPLEQTSSKGE